MDVILIPGLWLDASSWDEVLPALQRAGHTGRPLTLPGAGSTRATDIGLDDWIAAVVEHIDDLAGPVALVGHSGGGNVAWGAADARPDRVAHVVFVDTVPPPAGAEISEFPVVDGVVPFPGWDFFDEPDIADLDADTRARWAERVGPVPRRVPTDPLRLTDARRHRVPVTVLSGSADDSGLRAMLAEWPPFADEFAAIQKARVVELGSGHWPQFSQPARLAAEIVAALD
ncbi:alpha/beta hydrolase [Microbacterium sp. NM3R9]|uniref:alpha/beta fold hydrolase n=1 Tax=Microbacterium thalli TaxID=3027921 RepID=UPI0023663D54|nr:alpha/beta hydrolase [Microbacterium thalli]MDD7930140.1 alpha/beta hydrolase [Microbacterium thalli]MDN8549426.1 alpha/beta hydrolase [Microbacterium thalli]